MSKIVNKLTAMVLATILLSANLILVASYGSEVLAANSELENQNAQTNQEQVEFDAYFEKGKHSLIADSNRQDTKIYFRIKVKDAGYLRNAQIDLSDTNFQIVDSNQPNNYIQNIDLEKNSITLTQINNNSDIVIELNIKAIQKEVIASNVFSKDSKIQFTGMYTNANGKSSNVKKEIVIHCEWNNEAKAVIRQSISKYIPYQADGTSGLILQTMLEANIENAILPIKTTTLEIVAPTLNGFKPEKVLVTANQTVATNGMLDGINFGENNWNYDADKNIITIMQENVPDEKGMISWNKTGIDQYVITYIYSQETLKSITEQGVAVNLEANGKFDLYNNVETKIEARANNSGILTEAIDNIVKFSVHSKQNEISKGYLYTNKVTAEANKKETDYAIEYRANIGYAEIIDKIRLEQQYDQFTTDKTVSPTTVSGVNYTYDKTITIAKKVFDKFLGEEGYVNFLNQEGAILGTFNKDTLPDANGNLVYDASALNINNIIIETSKPKTEGTISFTVQKAIKSNIDYSASQIQMFTNLQVNLVGKAINDETNMVEETTEGTILLQEPVAKAEIAINNPNISTLLPNENVEIKAILKTNSAQDALYKNPRLLIELPEYIETITIKDISILYDDELKVQSYQVIDNGNTKLLEIQLAGIQTKYNTDEVTTGTNILIYADINANKLTPSKEAELKMYYTNENTTLFENKVDDTYGVTTAAIKFVAPIGMVTVNSVKNYSVAGTEVTAINGKDESAVLDLYATGRTATMEGQIINNLGNNATNVMTLGRVPAKGQTQIEGQADLGNTIDTILQGPIEVTGVNQENIIVYYSTNPNAGKDLNTASNGWTTNVSDYTTIKSYLIVLKNYTMQTGETIHFSYKVAIPDNLPHNEKAVAVYKVYYENNSSIGAMPENIIAPTVELTTGQGPELQATVSSAMQENSVVRTGQYVKFKVDVKNIGEVDAEEVNVKVAAPWGTLHAHYEDSERTYSTTKEVNKTIPVGSLKVGETKTIEYLLKIASYGEYSNDNKPYDQDNPVVEEKATAIDNVVTVVAKDLAVGVTSNTYHLKIEEGSFAIENIPNISEDSILKTGNKIIYTVKINNITNKDLTNVIFTEQFSNMVKMLDAHTQEAIATTEINRKGITYDENANKLTVKLDKLPANNVIYLIIETQVKENAEGDISSIIQAQADGVPTHYSNEVIHRAERVKLEVEAVMPDNQYIKEGTQFTYQYKIKNTGNITTFDTQFETQIPEGIKFLKAEYQESGKKYTTSTLRDGKLIINPYEIKNGQELVITITASANKLPNQNEKAITTYGTIEATGISKTESNKITFYIEYDAGNHTDDEENNGNNGNEQNNRYKITGVAWLDTNKNGKREENEDLLSGIQVLLLNKSNSSIVTDIDNGAEKIAITDDRGGYEFNNLVPGEYLVAFLYDTTVYDLTEYDASDVSQSLNSDAINMAINYNNKIQDAGMTNTLTITNSNLRNIDIGLILSEKFDLKLDKYVSKVTVQNPKSPRTYTYNNEKLVKVEILRGNIPSSTVIIEYKIVVTNEGAVPGYAKKIVDNFAKDLKFSSELNKDWYLSEDGKLYNASLANTIINPGESKELTLVLTKKMELENTGVVNNTAEIYEAYNDKGTADINSVPGNNDTKENDWSSADVAIILSTGSIITYTGLTLSVIAIIGIGIYGIKRHVIGKKEE